MLLSESVCHTMMSIANGNETSFCDLLNSWSLHKLVSKRKTTYPETKGRQYVMIKRSVTRQADN